MTVPDHVVEPLKIFLREWGIHTWHLDEVVLKIAGVKHWLWRAMDQTGAVLDVVVQRRRDKQAAKRLLRKLLKRQCGRLVS